MMPEERIRKEIHTGAGITIGLSAVIDVNLSVAVALTLSAGTESYVEKL